MTSTLSQRIRANLDSGRAEAFETDGRWVSWPQVAAVAARVEALLQEMGIGANTAIGLAGRNHVWNAAAMLGLLAGERCVAPINPFQPQERMVADTAKLALAAVIVEPEDLTSGEFEALARGAGIGLISLGGMGPDDAGIVVARDQGKPAPDSGQTAVLMPTSGPTGTPKRIPIRFDSLNAANRDSEVAIRDFGELDAPAHETSPMIQYSPIVHISGTLNVARCGSEGRRLILVEKFEAAPWVDIVERHAIRVAGLPPTMMKMLLILDPPPERLASLKGVWSGSAPVDMSVVKEFEARYGARVMGNYGATEFCGPIASGCYEDRDLFGDTKEGTVGRLRRGVVNARVVDPETGEVLPAGAVGVLELQVHRMGPEWMRSSDLASLDADNFLFIHGRADDAIIRGGFKIVPSVIGDALKRHPRVNDVSVIGIPHERLGQTPVAAVEVRPGPPLSGEELMDFLRSELVAYQVPTEIKVLDALPRTPSMKVDKAAVKALF